MTVTPAMIRRPVVDKLINFVVFMSRDALSAQMPFGKPHSQLPQRLVRTMRSPLLAPNERDDRPVPKPDDPDFHNRTREYTFSHVEVAEATGVVTAVYSESM